MMAEATSQGEAMQGERTLHPDLNRAEQHVHQDAHEFHVLHNFNNYN